MTNNNALISVIMSVYNTERFVGEAINSILAQTHSHFEFIIVDGGSTDGSADIVREFAARDARIQALFLPHCSQSHALNVGLEIARGEWVAFMEADDVVLPQRLAVQLAWVHQTGVDICGGLVKRFGFTDSLLWFPETHEAICNELLFRCVLLPSTVLMRTTIAQTNPFDEQSVWLDYEMWTRLAPHYRLGNVQQILAKYRHHSQQITSRKAAQVRAERQEYSRRYFREMFPTATTVDYAALACITEGQTCPDLATLERAGQWLVRLAQTPDNFLRRRMADRWRSDCRRSTQLGLPVYRLYREIAPQFQVYPIPQQRALWLACALRLKLSLRGVKWLKRIVRMRR